MKYKLNKDSNEKTTSSNIPEGAREYFSKLIDQLKPSLLQMLLLDEKLDRSRLSDISYVKAVLDENFEELIKEVEIRISLENDLLLSAKEAIQADRPEVAIILMATAIEHKLNEFLRDVLQVRLPDEVITEAVRSNMPAKMGWLMILASEHNISDELRTKIQKITRLRNNIVHYKSVPKSLIYEKNPFATVNGIESLDRDSLLKILDDLEDELEIIRQNILPDYKLSHELAKMLETVIN